MCGVVTKKIDDINKLYIPKTGTFLCLFSDNSEVLILLKDIENFKDIYAPNLFERQQNFKRQIENYKHFKCGEQEIICNFGSENIEKIIFSALEI